MSNKDAKIPEFSLYGEGIPAFDNSIQPALDLRSWSAVPKEERVTALSELSNKGWTKREREILNTIEYLNHTYLRLCPGKDLHKTPKAYARHGRPSSETERWAAAKKDFCRIFLEEDEPLVLRMLSKFGQLLINTYALERAKDTNDSGERTKYVDVAFDNFDRFANCVNHVFEQFAVNQLMTRNGFMPRQDETIEQKLYKPTLKALSDPKWVSVNERLSLMFEDFREGKFPETITKAHSAVHGFLQILVGEPGSNAKGEFGKLMRDGKSAGLIPTSRFTEPFLSNIQSFIASERATNSTAKPSLGLASSSDALLMMNMTLLFLQHCLHGNNDGAT